MSDCNKCNFCNYGPAGVCGCSKNRQQIFSIFKHVVYSSDPECQSYKIRGKGVIYEGILYEE